MFDGFMMSSRAAAKLASYGVTDMQQLKALSHDEIKEIVGFNPDIVDRSGYASVLKALELYREPVAVIENADDLSDESASADEHAEFEKDVPARAVKRLLAAGISTTAQLVSLDEDGLKAALGYDSSKADRVGFTSTWEWICRQLNMATGRPVGQTVDLYSCFDRMDRVLPDGFEKAGKHMGKVELTKSGRRIQLSEGLMDGRIGYKLLNSRWGIPINGFISVNEPVRLEVCHAD